MCRLLILSLVTLLTLQAEAAEKKETGFKLNVTVKGFFAPEVTSATVQSVEPNSLAESLGVETGDKLISIMGCKIPGCPASQAKSYISQKVGTRVSFEFVSTSGKNYKISIPLT
ncbi:PDZ domain-containing protein [Alteromonas macleodii]|jgi:C-terminal processing protease CtpA/Prc|uniref:PDZ domain-containing protein n=1 Tax=Alteromonas macleodii TaxID=28108 RepID=UPI002FE2DDB0